MNEHDQSPDSTGTKQGAMEDIDKVALATAEDLDGLINNSVPATPEQEARLDAAAGLTTEKIRLPIELVDFFKEIARQQGYLNYHTVIRVALTEWKTQQSSGEADGY